MTDIWIVVTEDCHADTEVTPFTEITDAIFFAESEALAGAHDLNDVRIEDLNDALRADGWVWHCQYSCEGDCVRVVRRELRETAS